MSEKLEFANPVFVAAVWSVVYLSQQLLRVTAQCPYSLIDNCLEQCTCAQTTSYFLVNCTYSDLGAKDLPLGLPSCLDPALNMTIQFNLSHSNLTLFNISHWFQDSFIGNISVLDLSFNQLSSLDTLHLTSMPSLKELYLHNNHFTSLTEQDLDSVSTVLENLELLTLYDNPWLCECSLKPFSMWLSRLCELSLCANETDLQKSQKLDMSAIRCHYPHPGKPIMNLNLNCPDEKRRKAVPTYVSVIVALVLVYLVICAFVAICIVIRNRHKVKASDDVQLS